MPAGAKHDIGQLAYALARSIVDATQVLDAHTCADAIRAAAETDSASSHVRTLLGLPPVTPIGVKRLQIDTLMHVSTSRSREFRVGVSVNARPVFSFLEAATEEQRSRLSRLTLVVESVPSINP
jgi:hypothetical protein